MRRLPAEKGRPRVQGGEVPRYSRSRGPPATWAQASSGRSSRRLGDPEHAPVFAAVADGATVLDDQAWGHAERRPRLLAADQLRSRSRQPSAMLLGWRA